VSYPPTTEDNEHRAKAVECENDTFLLLNIAAPGEKEAWHEIRHKIYYTKTVRHVFTKTVQIKGTTQFFFPPQ